MADANFSSNAACTNLGAYGTMPVFVVIEAHTVDAKQLHRQIVQRSLPQYVQTNLARIVHHNVQSATRAAPRGVGRDTLPGNRLLPLTNRVRVAAAHETVAGQAPVCVRASVSLLPKEDFVRRASEIDQRGHTDSALDLIYDAVDEWMRAGRFDDLDAIVGGLNASDYSLDLLLGILTATLPAASRLPSRKRFLQEAETVLRRRGEYEDGLLAGL